MKRLWHIRIQYRVPYNGRYLRNDCRAYREYMVWPKTFPTAKEADNYMLSCFTFRGLSQKKMAASTCQCH